MRQILKLNNVTLSYGKTPVLKDITLSFNSGDYVAIVGPNGSGKTTLIRGILGIHQCSSGTIEKKCTKISYLPQKIRSMDPLFPATVFEVVKTGKKRAEKKDVLDVVEKMQVSHLLNQRIGDLSGGQTQRVLLARALISQPDLLILDEPTSALDPESRSELYHLISKLNVEDHVTILMVSHDVHTLGDYAKTILYLDGAVEFFGSASEYYEQYEGRDHPHG